MNIYTEFHTRTPRAILSSAAMASFIISFIFSWNLLGLQFSLSILLFEILLVSMIRTSKIIIDNYLYVLLSLIAIVSLFVSFRASPELAAFNIIFSLVGLSVAVIELVKPAKLKVSDYILGHLATFIPSIASIPLAFRLSKINIHFSMGKRNSQIVRGILIAVPLLFIFGLLFSAADAVFADIASNIFNIELTLSGELIGRSLAFITIYLVSVGYLSFAILRKRGEQTEELTSQAEHNIEMGIVLGSLNAIFALFLAIQAVYLFGGREVVLEGDLTYAEYGRRGFFELVAVSALVFLVVFFGRRFIDTTKTIIPKMLMFGLTAQVGVVMLSAIKRLSLYEEVFGFTLLRFYSHSFIFFLAAAFVVLVYAIHTKMKETQILRYIFLGLGLYLLGINMVSPDAYIAQKNLNKIDEGGSVDYSYFKNLSVDAIDQKLKLVELVNSGEIEVKEAESRIWEGYLLELCYDRGYVNRQESFSTFNFSRYHTQQKFLDSSIECNFG